MTEEIPVTPDVHEDKWAQEAGAFFVSTKNDLFPDTKGQSIISFVKTMFIWMRPSSGYASNVYLVSVVAAITALLLLQRYSYNRTAGRLAKPMAAVVLVALGLKAMAHMDVSAIASSNLGRVTLEKYAVKDGYVPPIVNYQALHLFVDIAGIIVSSSILLWNSLNGTIFGVPFSFGRLFLLCITTYGFGIFALHYNTGLALMGSSTDLMFIAGSLFLFVSVSLILVLFCVTLDWLLGYIWRDEKVDKASQKIDGARASKSVVLN